MKIKPVLTIACCFSFFQAFSFSDTTISPKDLKNLVGCWQGSITYLDYTSNKPFTMPSDLQVKDFGNSNIIPCSILYPQEPKANSLDTMLISGDGRLLNNEPVKTKRKFSKDSLEIVTEVSGTDGNDNKEAVLRHTYTLGNTTYSIKKEVQFTGQPQWILRNEYRFTRKKPCN